MLKGPRMVGLKFQACLETFDSGLPLLAGHVDRTQPETGPGIVRLKFQGPGQLGFSLLQFTLLP